MAMPAAASASWPPATIPCVPATSLRVATLSLTLIASEPPVRLPVAFSPPDAGTVSDIAAAADAETPINPRLFIVRPPEIIRPAARPGSKRNLAQLLAAVAPTPMPMANRRVEIVYRQAGIRLTWAHPVADNRLCEISYPTAGAVLAPSRCRASGDWRPPCGDGLRVLS